MEAPIYCPLCKKKLIDIGQSLFCSIIENGINFRHYYFYKNTKFAIREVIKLESTTITIIDNFNGNYITQVNQSGNLIKTFDYRLEISSLEAIKIKLECLKIFK